MKRKLFMMIAGVMALLLPACGAKEDERNGAVVVEGITSDESDFDGNGYQKIYGRIVSETEEGADTFSLIYLDRDDVPELVVYDTAYGTYSIYTVKDGNAFCMVDSMVTVEMSYFEKTGIVAQFARWNGGGDEGGYGCSYYQVSREQTLADGAVPQCHYRYDAVNDADGNWTGEGITKYYQRDEEGSSKEIDEAAYRKIEEALGIVEGNKLSCGENALGKENMLKLLGAAEPAGAGGLEGQIMDQSFETELDGFGKVVFASFEPIDYISENPEYGTTMFGDVRFKLLSPENGEEIFGFPGETDDNILIGFTQFKRVLSVAFKDYNEDGRKDILILSEYQDPQGEPYRKARAYTQKNGEKEFTIDQELSAFLCQYTESMDQVYEGLAAYKAGNGTFGEGISEEEMMADLNKRMEYYRKSAYYEEITDYWENVRGVRDVSNRIEPLYESDRMYLTREMVSDDPPAVIYLAKNEIYARHGYWFEGQDLYNYFMGCTWYSPTVKPEDFSDKVFNEYEKENLKLLNEMAGGFQAKEAYRFVLENLYQTHTLPDGTTLGYDEITDLSWNKFAVFDIDRDGKEELIILWTTAYTAGMSGIVYGFDSGAGAVRAELLEYPLQTFYDNGVVRVELSHNHGMAGEIEDFWPHTFYRYDKNTDQYVLAAEVDAWNKAYYEKDYNEKPFPDDLDKDGDGILYRVTTGKEDKLMDLKEYQKWQDSITGGAKKVEIPFVEMTEKNIKAVSGNS